MAVMRKLTFSTDSYMVDVFDAGDGEQVSLLNDGRAINADGVIVGTKKVPRPRRVEEINVLKILADAAGMNAKTLKEANLCGDLVETIENITDSDDSIVVTKQDIENLVNAFNGLSGRRSATWLKYCRSILSQLENPKEVEVGEKNKKE
jgi:hypothetical protein